MWLARCINRRASQQTETILNELRTLFLVSRFLTISLASTRWPSLWLKTKLVHSRSSVNHLCAEGESVLFRARIKMAIVHTEARASIFFGY